MTAIYSAHFGLHEAPFSISPDPRFVCMSGRFREAFAHLLYGLEEGGGFVQLTGEVGTGKTTICRTLISQLPRDVDVALILNPKLSVTELLQTLCEELHIPMLATNPSNKQLTDRLRWYLLKANAEGRRTVLIIDEAQNLAPDVLEQVRLLTNLETERNKLLQIFLIGQPELRTLLARPELRQVAQRITARYHLTPLTAAETRRYVEHRLEVAGAPSGTALFTPMALRAVHHAAGGIPRLVNIISDRALLGTYATGLNQVTAPIALRAAREVKGTQERFAALPGWLAPTVAGVACIALVGAGWQLWQARSVDAYAPPTVADSGPAVVTGGPRLAEPVGAASPADTSDSSGASAASRAAAFSASSANTTAAPVPTQDATRATPARQSSADTSGLPAASASDLAASANATASQPIAEGAARPSPGDAPVADSAGQRSVAGGSLATGETAPVPTVGAAPQPSSAGVSAKAPSTVEAAQPGATLARATVDDGDVAGRRRAAVAPTGTTRSVTGGPSPASVAPVAGVPGSVGGDDPNAVVAIADPVRQPRNADASVAATRSAGYAGTASDGTGRARATPPPQTVGVVDPTAASNDPGRSAERSVETADATDGTAETDTAASTTAPNDVSSTRPPTVTRAATSTARVAPSGDGQTGVSGPTSAAAAAEPRLGGGLRSAEDALLATWGIERREADSLCESASRAGLRCVAGAADLDRLARLDRPVLLALRDGRGGLRYAALLGLRGARAELSSDAAVGPAATETLLRQWNGRFTTLLPDELSGRRSLWPGARGNDVDVLRATLARLDGRTTGTSAGRRFDEQLYLAVQAFQRRERLGVDGVVGPATRERLRLASTTTGPRLLTDRQGTR